MVVAVVAGGSNKVIAELGKVNCNLGIVIVIVDVAAAVRAVVLVSIR